MSLLRRITLFALLLASGLIIAGCGPQAEDYYPLKVGNAWEYQTKYPDGRILTDGDQIIKRYENAYYFNNGEIIIRLSGDALINRNGLRILRHPFRPGTQWSDRSITMKITSVGDRIEVPAGVFDKTITVAWEATRKGPVTMSADDFVNGPVPGTPGAGASRNDGLQQERPDYPLRHFISTTVFAKDIGPVRYKLEATEIGKEMRTILVSDLVSYQLR